MKRITFLFVAILFVACSKEEEKEYDCECESVQVYDEKADDRRAFVNLRRCEFYDESLQVFYEESDFNEIPLAIALGFSREQGCR